MVLKSGSNSISKIYLGLSEVKKAYLGGNLIYQANSSSAIANNGFITDGLSSFLHAGRNTASGYDPNATNWYDLTGNGYNGSLSNFNYDSLSGWQGDGTEVNPHCLLFDGINDFVTLFNTQNLISGVMSCQLTVKIPYYNWYSHVVTRKTSLWETSRGLDVKTRPTLEGGSVNVIQPNYSGFSTINMTYCSASNVINLAFVCDGSNFKVYRNGNIINSSLGTFNGNINTSLTLGSLVGGGYYLKYYLYNFAYYDNKALSLEEIQQNYNAGLVWK